MIGRGAAGNHDPEQAGAGGAAQPGRPRRPRTILVVEDNAEIRELLTLVLEEEGHRVVPVAEGGEALAAARAHRPDLITLDLALPGRDGWELVREIQADEQTRDIPILVISAYTRQLTDPLRGRVARVISKPFYINQIVHEVERLLA